MASEFFGSATDASASAVEIGGSNQQKSRASDGYPVPRLPFPTTFESDPTKFLSPLRDNHSHYDAIAKTCQVLNQYAANGSSKATKSSKPEESDSSNSGLMEYVESSSLFHDSSFAQILSESFDSLLECIREHHDRRCRILACKTVALVARAAYARLRNSPHTFTGMRDDTANSGNIGTNSTSNTGGSNYINRLDDEIGTDVPMALCIAALEDSDDGVAATAMSSLGILILSTVSTPGTLNDDELWSEVRAILQVGQQHHAPSARALVDEDSATQQSELQVRVFESTICPRLFQLVSRFVALNHPSHVSMVLPVLTASLVYLSKTTMPSMASLVSEEEDGNKATSNMKRRVGEQSDCNALTEIVVTGMLLPCMREMTVLTMGASMAAAFSSIRLIHAYPLAPWTKELSRSAIAVLKEECGNNNLYLEAQLPTLATLVILSRAIPLSERIDTVLEFLADRVLELPSTTMVPSGVVSAGLLLMDKQNAGGFMAQYRKPTRPAFWAEIALSFFMDGPVEPTTGKKSSVRSKALTQFLQSSKILDILEDQCGDNTSIGTHSKVREEFVTSFCMVAFEVGRRHRLPIQSARGMASLKARRDELEEWIKLSLALLNAFSPCIGWGSVGFSNMFLDEEMSMLVACQAAYTQLLQEVMHAAGLLTNDSISLNMTPFTSPPLLLWDQMEKASEYLLQFDPMPVFEKMVEPIGNLLDDIVKREMRGAGIVSHHMRQFLMSLAVDQWVQARNIALQKGTSSEGGMNIENVKQLLVTISPRRMVGKVVESNRSQIENISSSKKERYKKFAQDTANLFVACIENIALMGCHYKNTVGASSDTKAILNYSLKSLGNSGNDSDTPVSSVCQDAIDRIQSAFQSAAQTDLPLQSPLIPEHFQGRSTIGNARISQGRDAFNEGFMTQLSRQVISSRAERCILSFPPLFNLTSKVRKQNWLRLSPPPLPHSQDSHPSVNNIPKFKWGSNVAVCTAGSDPAAVTLSHYTRRNMRYDGEDDFRLVVSIRVDNLIAADIPNGLRLELGITEENTSTSANAQDAVSVQISNSLSEGYESVSREDVFGYSTVRYDSALKSGDHITWDVMINPLPMTGSISLNPSIVFQALDKELPCATWVTADTQAKGGEEGSTASGSGSSKVGGEIIEEKKDSVDEDEKQDILVSCEPMKLSPMTGLQPCPLVFFRNGLGDIESFRFLWTRMPYQLTPFKIVADSNYDETSYTDHDARRLAILSNVKFEGNPIQGGMVTQLWAFISPKGKRVMFILGEQDGEDSKTLHVRGDDKQLLLCLVGTSSSRSALISALKPGLKPVYQEVFK